MRDARRDLPPRDRYRPKRKERVPVSRAGVIDGALEAQLGNRYDVAGGFYPINATAGDYELNITADNGTPLDVLFQVQ